MVFTGQNGYSFSWFLQLIVPQILYYTENKHATEEILTFDLLGFISKKVNLILL